MNFKSSVWIPALFVTAILAIAVTTNAQVKLKGSAAIKKSAILTSDECLGGFSNGGYCYYLGGATENCFSVCSGRGGCLWQGIDNAAASTTTCNTILNGLGLSSSGGSTSSGYFYACAGNGTTARANSGSVQCSATPPAGWFRACACGAGGTTAQNVAQVDGYNYRLGPANFSCDTVCASYGGCVLAGLTNAFSAAKCDEILAKLDVQLSGTAGNTDPMGCGTVSAQRYLGSSTTCAGTSTAILRACACANP